MTINPLPDIKQQFLTQHFEPVREQLSPYRASMEVAFEQAKEQYETLHRHQFPYSYRTFCRYYYNEQV